MRQVFIIIIVLIIVLISGCTVNIGTPVTSQKEPTSTPVIVYVTITPTPKPQLSDSIVGTWTSGSLGGYLFYPDYTVTLISYPATMGSPGGPQTPLSPVEYHYGIWKVDGDHMYSFYFNGGKYYTNSGRSPTYQVLIREDNNLYFVRQNTGSGYEEVTTAPPFNKKSDYPNASEILWYE